MKKQLPKAPNFTATAIANGINSVRLSGARLARDAQLLLEQGSHATAFSLAVLALEEFGKERLFMMLAIETDEKERSELWSQFRSHHAKNIVTVAAQRINKGAKNLNELLLSKAERERYSDQIERRKQQGVYSEWKGNVRFSDPNNEITPQEAKEMVENARSFCPENRTNQSISKEEIELYIKHVQPAWASGNKSAIKQALIQYNKEANDRRLRQDTNLESYLS